MKKLLLLASICFSAQLIFAQGNLPPPGAPSPTMKSLDQIEPRVVVNAINTPGNVTNTFIINAPGSYYLTGNTIGAAGKHGISILTNDVTLDLNGFALISGGGGAFRGINVPAGQTNICIRNGTVKGWTDGGVRTDFATCTIVEKLRLSDNVGATGLALGNGLAKDCVATGNATGFVIGNGAQIKDSTATANTTGFSTGDRAMLNNCIATVNTQYGFNCTSYVTMTDCTSSRNGLYGIVVAGSCSLTRCSATRNDIDGVSAGSGCTIADCTAGVNGYDGFRVGTGSSVRNCTAQSNGSAGVGVDGSCYLSGNTCDANSRGIYAGGSGNRIDGNSCTGNTLHGFSINLDHNIIIRNTARGNGVNYSIPAGNASGPIVDMTAGGTISSTSPWANFSY